MAVNLYNNTLYSLRYIHEPEVLCLLYPPFEDRENNHACYVATAGIGAAPVPCFHSNSDRISDVIWARIRADHTLTTHRT